MYQTLHGGTQTFETVGSDVVGNESQEGKESKAIIYVSHVGFMFSQVVILREQPEKNIMQDCGGKQ